MSSETSSSHQSYSNTLILSVENTEVCVRDEKLVIPANLDYEDWKKALHAFKRAKALHELALSEMVSYGVSNYGEDKVEAAFEQLEFDLLDANHALALGRTDRTLRSDQGLTNEHLYVLGKAFPDDPETQRAWADLTKEHQLKASDLKLSIAQGKPIVREARTPGMLTLEVVLVQFNRCRAGLEKVFATIPNG
jgi:hypothetical protein